jgi:hypothetical protein
MREFLALLVIIVGALLPGGLALYLGGRRLADDVLEFIFAGLGLGLLICGWLALVLAEAGWFSLTRLGALWAIGVLILIWLVWRSRRQGMHSPSFTLRFGWREPAALILWAVGASLIFFRPHEFVIGGGDAGVYVNLGANITRTGSLLIADPMLAGLDPALYPAFLRAIPPTDAAAPYYLLPGFYVPAMPRGMVIPQFYPLHPVWLAIGYALGGIRADLLMTPLWAMLGCLAVYMTARALWGWKVALLTIGALSLTSLQVWFARYPTAEMLTQYLLWMGMWALVGWADKRPPRGLWAALAGLSLGSVLLTRIDMYFLLAVPLLMAAWLAWTHDWQWQDGWFFVPFTSLTLHSVLHGAFLSRPYFLTLMGYGNALITRNLALPLAVFGIGLAAIVILSRRRDWVDGIAARLSTWPRYGRWAGAALVAGLALYGYFLRPHLEQAASYAYWYGGGNVPRLDQENLVRLGWYLSPFGLALGTCGVCWMLIKEVNRRTALLLGVGLFFSLLYLWRMRINPHQVYAMRRYMPHVVPFLTLSAAYLLSRLGSLGSLGPCARCAASERSLGRPQGARLQSFSLAQSRGKVGDDPRPQGARLPLPPFRFGIAGILGIGLTLIWIVGIVGAARGFVSQVDYRGIVAQLDQLDAALSPHSVLIFNDPAPVGVGDFVGTPLRFLYGHDVLTLRDAQALDVPRFETMVRRWQSDGQAVYWMAVPGGLPWPGVTLNVENVQETRLVSQALEGSYERKPQAIVEIIWPLSLLRVVEGSRP